MANGLGTLWYIWPYSVLSSCDLVRQRMKLGIRMLRRVRLVWALRGEKRFYPFRQLTRMGCNNLGNNLGKSCKHNTDDYQRVICKFRQSGKWGLFS